MSASSAVCGDCGALEPGWASINRGVLICDECCSVHRLLGRHISNVRSITHGLWPPTMLEMTMTLVSKGANCIWEHSLLDCSHGKSSKRKPKAHHAVHPNKYDFITSKYKHLAFTNRLSNKDHGQVSTEDLSQQLHASVRTGNLETVLRLLSLGAEVNFFHLERGNTPLHVASSAGQPLQVELLVEYGANPCTLDSRGHTPVECARIAGYHELADRLIECQYDLTDRLAFYLCGRKPSHADGEHYIIPPLIEEVDVSEAAVTARQKLHALTNGQFERLAADVYDEVDRRETDAIWLATQNHSKLVSDHHIMPFLPVNPALSATLNQGRQKLATFSASEFATLLVDVLTDAKRRQLESHEKGTVDGTVVPIEFVQSEEDTGDHDYDEVYIEEFGKPRDDLKAETEALAVLAAVVNSELNEEPVTQTETVNKEFGESRDDLKAEAEALAVLAAVVNSEMKDIQESGKSRDDLQAEAEALAVLADAVNSEMKETGTQTETVYEQHVVRTVNDVGVPTPLSSVNSDKISVAKHLEVQRKLSVAEARIVQLTKVNESMGEEIKLLQSMFQRLMSENSMLRQMQGKNIPRSSTAPSRLTRSLTAPVGEVQPKHNVTSMPLKATKEVPEDTVDGMEEKKSELVLQTDGGSHIPSVTKKQQVTVPEKKQEVTVPEKKQEVTVPEKKQQETVPENDVAHSEPAVEKQQLVAEPKDSPPALPVKKKRTRVLSVDTLPPSLSPTSQHAVRTVKQQQEQHRHTLTASPSLSLRRQHSLPTPLTSKGGTDAVVQQTEKITKRIQELLMAAQHGSPATFIPCSRRISSSVNDMASLFPQRPESEPIRAALRLLVSSATRLQQECKDVHNATVSSVGLEETPDVACLTQQVIQSAYDIAKAAKQLVTHSAEL